jgi:hypothetical protein
VPVAEAELGELVQQGNVEACTALYDACAPSVHDFLLRLVRDPTAAEDLAMVRLRNCRSSAFCQHFAHAAAGCRMDRCWSHVRVGAPGGDPGTYVVSPSGQAVRLTASGVPVGLLDAKSP